MKITVDGIEIAKGTIKAVVMIEEDLRSLEGDSFTRRHQLAETVIERLANQIVLERGADIMAKITENQMVNALLMKVAGKLAGDRN